ncbi:MAG: DUF3794 domain-containing protein [Oscillospiraceae bacterium]|nr:DUF3794 domain-containing protein [Oscillospiraceae bacterium]
MEILFQAQTITYLAEKRYDDLQQEQRGEITIPETLPELGRVIDSFGAVLIHERTVDSGSVRVTGEIQTGILYVPAGEEGVERLDLSLPFTVTKKVPTQTDSMLHCWCWLRSIDVRFVNSRKLLVRVGLSSELTLLTPAELTLQQLAEAPRGLVCKTETYPMRLPLCAAEKEVQIADEVLMPEDGPGADRLLKAQCTVTVTERRVLGDKAVFQGALELRILAASEDGRLFTWSGTVPYSQYVELERTCAETDDLSVQPILRHLEIDTDGQPDSRRLLINVSFIAQTVLWGEVPVTLTQDAYYLDGELAPQWETCALTPCLDRIETALTQSVELPAEAERVLDWTCFRDRTVSVSGGEAAQTALGVNLLYYDADSKLQSRMLRRELRLERQAEQSADWRCTVQIEQAVQPQGRQLLLPLSVSQSFFQSAPMRNLCGAELKAMPRADGPSLIVRTAAGDLWSIARDNGSTVRAIQTANELEEAALNRERLLLIPTGRGVNTLEEVTE